MFTPQTFGNQILSGGGKVARTEESKIPEAQKSDPKPKNENVSPLIYPPDMRGDSSRPCIVFCAHERALSGITNQHRIWFPAPGSLAFGDNADYAQTALGIGGTAAAGAANLVSGDSGANVFDKIVQKAKNASSIGALQSAVIASAALPDGLQTAANLGQGQVINPNTNTTFNANGVRQFGFKFHMSARNEKESVLIRDIQSKFRHFTYASRGGPNSAITLEYPPVWTIKFMNMNIGGGEENKFIPRIYSCYCTAVNTTYNSTGNIYFSDNAPLECEIELQFTETRALNRTDIDNMEKAQLGDERGIDSGRPTFHGSEPAPIKQK
tara:strand:+ start:503 stop:1477 length:975 start_codon:yes stop_codon:yes gene_type:complete